MGAHDTGDRQQNQCSQAANDGGNQQFEVGDCDKQRGEFNARHGRKLVGLISVIDECLNAQNNAQVKDFNTGVAAQNIGPDPDFPDFDLICDA